jgi:hypothetical protein
MRETRARRRRMSFTRKDTSRCRNRLREGGDHHRRRIIAMIIGVTNIGLHRHRTTDAGLRRTIDTVLLRMSTDRRLRMGTDHRLRMGTVRLRMGTDIRLRRRIASATCLRLLARLRAVRRPRTACPRTTMVKRSPLKCPRLRRRCHRRRRRTPYHSST